MIKEYKLIGGPSKFDLLFALFDAKIINFRSDNHETIVARVNGLKDLEDGKDTWSIAGWLEEKDHGGRNHNRQQYTATFSIKDRKGKLTVTIDTRSHHKAVKTVLKQMTEQVTGLWEKLG